MLRMRLDLETCIETRQLAETNGSTAFCLVVHEFRLQLRRTLPVFVCVFVCVAELLTCPVHCCHLPGQRGECECVPRACQFVVLFAFFFSNERVDGDSFHFIFAFQIFSCQMSNWKIGNRK